MIPSQVIDWLNENEFRAYPLAERGARIVPGTSLLLDRFILDAALTATVPPVSQTASVEIGITTFGKATNTAIITLSDSTAFTIDTSLTATFPAYLRSANGSLLVVGDAIKQVPNGNYAFTDVFFEPSVITEFSGPWNGVTSLTIGVTPPASRTGVITLVEGKQIDIKLTPGIIRLAAGSNYGLPVTCEDIPPEDNACSNIVSYLNGAIPFQSPGNVLLSAGANIRVFDDQANHRIYVGLAFETEDVCKQVTLTPKAVVT